MFHSRKLAFDKLLNEWNSVRLRAQPTEHVPGDRLQEARGRRVQQRTLNRRRTSSRAFCTRQGHLPSDAACVHVPLAGPQRSIGCYGHAEKYDHGQMSPMRRPHRPVT